MVRIPGGIKAHKEEHPNTLNKDGSITINGENWKIGDTFTSLCVRTIGSWTWGKMFRNAIIKDIRPSDENDMFTEVSISGTSDWEPCEDTFYLYQIV